MKNRICTTVLSNSEYFIANPNKISNILPTFYVFFFFFLNKENCLSIASSFSMLININKVTENEIFSFFKGDLESFIYRYTFLDYRFEVNKI